VALAVFDGAVNMGAGTSIKILQLCIGVETDGVLGPVTLAAVNRQSEHQILRNFLAQRAVYYMKIILNNPTLWKFSLGWMRRLFSLAEVLYLAWPKR
jgi:lysozyme family protein